MKILCTEYNETGDVAIVPVGDDVLLRNNGDFYIPDFTQEVSCVPQFVVKICKLGKAVGERFASRYYDEVGIGIRFYADSLEQALEAKGLPGIVASSFDSSAAISKMRKIENRSLHYEMFVNERAEFRGSIPDLQVGIDRLVALAGEMHTLKIGDYLYCGNPFRFRGVKAGDQIRVDLEGENVMHFTVR